MKMTSTACIIFSAGREWGSEVAHLGGMGGGQGEGEVRGGEVVGAIFHPVL